MKKEANTAMPSVLLPFYADEFGGSIASIDWPLFASRHEGAEYAYLAQELPSVDEQEQAALNELRYYVNNTHGLKDLRDFAMLARHLLPREKYEVGTGSSHVWIHRREEHEAARAAKRLPDRLAVIYDAANGKIWQNHDGSSLH